MDNTLAELRRETVVLQKRAAERGSNGGRRRRPRRGDLETEAAGSRPARDPCGAARPRGDDDREHRGVETHRVEALHRGLPQASTRAYAARRRPVDAMDDVPTRSSVLLLDALGRRVADGDELLRLPVSRAVCRAVVGQQPGPEDGDEDRAERRREHDGEDGDGEDDARAVLRAVGLGGVEGHGADGGLDRGLGQPGEGDEEPLGL